MAETRLDYGCLLDWTQPAAVQAYDAPATSAVRTFGTDEGFQIDSIWVFPPFDGMGNLENLRVQVLVDGASYDLINMHSSTAPPYLANSNWISLPLGNKLSNNPILNTCLKGSKQIQIKTYGGRGGVTGEYEIKLYGDYFKGDKAVQKRFGATFNPTPVSITDGRRINKSVSVYRPTPATIKNLANMSGGAPKADYPRVLPYITYAWNRAATTINQPYSYSLDELHVLHDFEDLRWNYTDSDALWITHLAAQEQLHSQELWIQVADEEYPKGDPTNLPHFDIGQFTNELPFSNFASTQPPRKYNLLLTNEKADLRVRDDGTPLGANTQLVGVWGKKFELKSG